MTPIQTFPRCDHPHNCGCSGGVTSYETYYEKVLAEFTPRKVFEWGPGRNTQQAMSLDSTEQIFSVEQDKAWIPALQFRRQVVIHVQVRSPLYLHLYGMQDADMFFVDSRRRSECLDVVRTQAGASAVVCLHDAQRARYHDALRKYTWVRFFIPGFAVATMSEDVYKRIAAL